MFGPFRLSEVKAALNAEIEGKNVPFSGVSTDSRTIQTGDLFVALTGDRFNGHEFLDQVQNSGASAVMIAEDRETTLPCIKVEDTLIGLGKLANYNRKQFDKPVVAITGSAGKTSVKEMTASILSTQGDVLATSGNLNNHIGAPLTLLSLGLHHDFGVIELGASGPKEIEYTAELTQPDVSILTNASEAHVEGFGSLEMIVETKGEIISALSDKGVAVLNADDPFFDVWNKRAGSRKVMSFGIENDAVVSADNIQTDEDGKMSFDLKYEGKTSRISLNVLGKHNVMNALAASAAALAVGVTLEGIQSGLAKFKGVAGRLSQKQGLNGVSILDDTYNANPASVKAALEAIKSKKGTRILVLGEMAEMGSEARRSHAEIGAYAKTIGMDGVYATGNFTRETVDAFGEGGHWFASKDAMIKELSKLASKDVNLLIKGSRSARMEVVVEALINEENKK